jgi:uncharacterized protein (DUF362 family)
MKTTLNRRRFLSSIITAAAGSALALSGCAPASGETAAPASPTTSPTQPAAPSATPPPAEAAQPSPTAQPALSPAGSSTLAVARGPDPEAITRAALKALGGMEAFVKAGQDVIVKPNICVDYHTFEYAATTNPLVVAALVKMALEAGAKRVRVLDMPFGGTPESAYQISGIAEAVQAAGGEMEIMSPVKFVSTPFPDGKDLKTWKVYKPALDTDVLINVPIAKDHSLARLTLSTKNLFGLVNYPDGLHMNLGQRAADLLSLYRPALTVIDAVRILTANGPTGGNLDDVKKLDTVIASRDGIAADAYGATLFGMKGEDISYIKAGAEMGLGVMDLSAVKIEEVNV